VRPERFGKFWTHRRFCLRQLLDPELEWVTQLPQEDDVAKSGLWALSKSATAARLTHSNCCTSRMNVKQARTHYLLASERAPANAAMSTGNCVLTPLPFKLRLNSIVSVYVLDVLDALPQPQKMLAVSSAIMETNAFRKRQQALPRNPEEEAAAYAAEADASPDGFTHATLMRTLSLTERSDCLAWLNSKDNQKWWIGQDSISTTNLQMLNHGEWLSDEVVTFYSSSSRSATRS